MTILTEDWIDYIEREIGELEEQDVRDLIASHRALSAALQAVTVPGAISIALPVWDGPRARGVARSDSAFALQIFFRERPTDDDMRALHDLLSPPSETV